MAETVSPVPQGQFTDANGNLTVEGRNFLNNLVRVLRDLQDRVATLETP
jgi:hypothetical protein